jgi:hypothetical protein
MIFLIYKINKILLLTDDAKMFKNINCLKYYVIGLQLHLFYMYKWNTKLVIGIYNRNKENIIYFYYYIKLVGIQNIKFLNLAKVVKSLITYYPPLHKIIMNVS